MSMNTDNFPVSFVEGSSIFEWYARAFRYPVIPSAAERPLMHAPDIVCLHFSTGSEGKLYGFDPGGCEFLLTDFVCFLRIHSCEILTHVIPPSCRPFRTPHRQ